jgi:predicted ATPase
MLKRVHIRNFKSLGDVVVDLGPVTVLIGRSGTGKTNFVEALRFLRDALLDRNIVATQQRYGGWEKLYCATGSKPDFLWFDLTFEAPGIAADYRYQLRYEYNPQGGGFRIPEEKLALGDVALLHHKDARWISAPSLVNPAAPRDVMLGGISGVQEITIAYLVLTNGLGCYDFPSGVLRAQSPQQPVPQHSPGGLSDRGENYLPVFNALVDNLGAYGDRRRLVAALKCLNRSVVNVDPRLPDRQTILVSHEMEGKSLVFDLSQESEGFRRYLAYLLALYQTPPKQTLVFEEPEKAIHPGALTALADEFTLGAEQGRGQVLLTSHSPTLLNHFEPEQFRVAEIHNHLTRIGPLAPDQVESLRQKLLDPGELLTVDPARITTPPVPVG